jgi:hypothetical protein
VTTTAIINEGSGRAVTPAARSERMRAVILQ